MHIDLYKVVTNQTMLGVNKKHGIIYNTNKLGDVTEAYGYGGKLDDLTAIEAIKYSSKDLLLRYNARDVDLTRQILQHNNYEILDLFYLIQHAPWKLETLRRKNIESGYEYQELLDAVDKMNNKYVWL